VEKRSGDLDRVSRWKHQIITFVMDCYDQMSVKAMVTSLKLQGENENVQSGNPILSGRKRENSAAYRERK
jgi:hypothetical protein